MDRLTFKSYLTMLRVTSSGHVKHFTIFSLIKPDGYILINKINDQITVSSTQ
jgi:hypothetical protein